MDSFFVPFVGGPYKGRIRNIEVFEKVLETAAYQIAVIQRWEVGVFRC